jgi:hypothetical protein
LAHLLGEERGPPAALWEAPLVASRLVEYEMWNRLNARGLGGTHGEAARLLMGRLALLELIPPVLARALEPFPVPVRTLDALHLASLDFLRTQGIHVELASYDDRMLEAAQKMSIPVTRHLAP